jgi:transposase
MTKVQSKSKKIAIVAIARKLAELMYSLLKNNTKYEKRAPVPVVKLATEALAIAS